MEQAINLKQRTSTRPVCAIAITSGKGGVGKTNISINLAVSLAKLNKDVLLLDADLGLANVDILLDLHPKKNLSHVLNGDCSIDDIVINGPAGLSILPSASGVTQMADLSSNEQMGLIQVFSELTLPVDILIIDTAAGVSESVISFTRAAHNVVVVVCDEPASITDAYAMIKVLHRDYGIERFQIISNMVRNEHEGQHLHKKISMVCDRFLDVNLHYLGYVPYDDKLKRAVKNQQAVVDLFPGCASAAAFTRIGHRIAAWQAPRQARGDMEYFVERLINASRGSGY